MTRPRKRSVVLSLAIGAALASLGVDPGARAHAQAGGSGSRHEQLTPPTPPPGQAGDGAGFLEYALAILLGGGMVGVCFLPSKRGHKD